MAHQVHLTYLCNGNCSKANSTMTFHRKILNAFDMKALNVCFQMGLDWQLVHDVFPQHVAKALLDGKQVVCFDIQPP
jgi:hypothetical protein